MPLLSRSALFCSAKKPLMYNPGRIQAAVSSSGAPIVFTKGSQSSSWVQLLLKIVLSVSRAFLFASSAPSLESSRLSFRPLRWSSSSCSTNVACCVFVPWRNTDALSTSVCLRRPVGPYLPHQNIAITLLLTLSVNAFRYLFFLPEKGKQPKREGTW